MASVSLPVEKSDLYVPPLADLAPVLENGLKENFKEVKVSIVDCPDLTQPPWHLAASGLGGSPRLLDIGGVPYLMPVVNRDKVYDLGQIAELAGIPNGFIFGAGAGSWRVKGRNCEMMPNIKLTSGTVTNCTFIASVLDEDGSALLEKYSSLETGPLVNVTLSEGAPGPVLEIKASVRTGEDNFVSCMRKALREKYGEMPVALGGVFLIEKGKAKLHIMPDFSKTPLLSDKDVKNWLKFYEMSSPLVCLSEFISHDPGLDLRVEHTHCFSNHGDGGHYHYDVTPDEVVYHAYYTVAEQVVRVDRPAVTHQIGRD